MSSFSSPRALLLSGIALTFLTAATVGGLALAKKGRTALTTLMFELRRRGGGIGVASMCAGGGMGSATVIEVPPGK